MKFTKSWKSLALACAVAASGLVAPAYASAQQKPAPDNSKVNTRDRQADQKTADQQTNHKSDLETSRQIRKSLVADKSLSTYAHNVKIITVDGKVTLKGPVRSAAEKTTVIDKANEVAGAANVTSQISVTPRKSSKG